MAGRMPRLLSAYPGHTGNCPGIYASYVTGRRPSPTLLGFQLYAISGRAHFRHRPMQLRAIHRGWAHSQAFGGNVSAFNANTTSEAFTRFAQLVWPHGYCWYPPKIKNNVCHGLPPAFKYVSLLCYFHCSRGCYKEAKRGRDRERAKSETTKPSCYAFDPVRLLSHISPIALAVLFPTLVRAQVLLLLLPSPCLFVGHVCSVIAKSGPSGQLNCLQGTVEVSGKYVLRLLWRRWSTPESGSSKLLPCQTGRACLSGLVIDQLVVLTPHVPVL